MRLIPATLFAVALALPSAAQDETEPVTVGGIQPRLTLDEYVHDHCFINVTDSDIVNAFGLNFRATRQVTFDADGELKRTLWFFARGEQGTAHLAVARQLAEAIENHLGIDIGARVDNDQRGGSWNLDRLLYVGFGPEGSEIERIQIKTFTNTVRVQIDFNGGARQIIPCLQGFE